MRYASMASLSWCSAGSILKVSAFVARFFIVSSIGRYSFRPALLKSCSMPSRSEMRAFALSDRSACVADSSRITLRCFCSRRAFLPSMRGIPVLFASFHSVSHARWAVSIFWSSSWRFAGMFPVLMLFFAVSNAMRAVFLAR